MELENNTSEMKQWDGKWYEITAFRPALWLALEQSDTDSGIIGRVARTKGICTLDLRGMNTVRESVYKVIMSF